MTFTKNDQFCDPLNLPPPSAKMNNSAIVKNNKIHKHVANFKTHPPLFRVDVINVWSLVLTKISKLTFHFYRVEALFFIFRHFKIISNCFQTYLPPPRLHSLDLGRPISNEPTPLSPNENQWIKRKHNPRMTIVCYQVLPSDQLSFTVSSH